jgi:hypothetical protein
MGNPMSSTSLATVKITSKLTHDVFLQTPLTKKQTKHKKKKKKRGTKKTRGNGKNWEKDGKEDNIGQVKKNKEEWQ